MKISTVDYFEQAIENSSSLLRDIPEAQALISAIIEYYQEQQLDLIWLSENLLNIDAAVGWHLDFIGMILNQPRILASFDTGIYFGFEGAYQSGTFGTLNDPSVGAVWYSSSSKNPSTSKSLNDDQYRRILKARAIKNNSKSCSHTELLQILNLLSNNKNCTFEMTSHGFLKMYCDDPEGFIAYFMSRLKTSDNILPIPLGVKVTMVGIGG